ncbi:SMC-Scp complex subunit ScpB [Bdellovibrionota bacterium FG-2]
MTDNRTENLETHGVMQEPEQEFAFVADPFHLDIAGILAAQASTEELALDDESVLERVADAVALSTKNQILENTQGETQEEANGEPGSLTGETPEEVATRLAQEIAEDQLLAKSLQEEIEIQAAMDAEVQPPAIILTTSDIAEVQSYVEALLFMSDRPVSMVKIREALSSSTGVDFAEDTCTEAIEGLCKKYEELAHGIEIVNVSGGYQFRTKPGRSAIAQKLSKIQTARLSRGAMESLAIIAYRQPVLKEEIDKVRGVDSSYFMRVLLDRKLIAISGRSDLPGRPILYVTTETFTDVFGLADLTALPPLHELEQMIPSSESRNPETEDPAVKKMREMVGKMKTDTDAISYDPREDERILKEIREKVNAIPTSTRSLDEQRAEEKRLEQLAKDEALGIIHLAGEEAAQVAMQNGI